MRFVAVKSEAKQALGMAFKTRDLFVRQRTQLINALRGHLAEYGVISPKGIVYLRRLQNVVETPDNGLPGAVIALACDLLKHARILFLGYSLGTYASPLIVKEVPKIKDIIMFADPNRPLYEIIPEQYEYILG